MKDEHLEKALEIGLGLFGALLLGGLGLLAFGRVGGEMGRAKTHAESPPSKGTVAPARHQNVAASSAR